MVALYDYAAQGPEDLEFSEGDTIDILSEGETPTVNAKPKQPCGIKFNLFLCFNAVSSSVFTIYVFLFHVSL